MVLSFMQCYYNLQRSASCSKIWGNLFEKSVARGIAFLFKLGTSEKRFPKISLTISDISFFSILLLSNSNASVSVQ